MTTPQRNKKKASAVLLSLIFTTFTMSRTALAFFLFLCGVVICGGLQNEESKNDDYGYYAHAVSSRSGMGRKLNCAKAMSEIAMNLINELAIGCNSYNRDECKKLKKVEKKIATFFKNFC